VTDTDRAESHLFRGLSAAQGTTLTVGWVMLLFVGAYLITPASILPLIIDDLGTGEATAASLVSMPQVAATVIGLPVGIYLDRIETRSIVPFAGTVLFVGSAGDWLAATEASVLLLTASRLLAGVGMFILWVVSVNVASNAFPPRQRATATSVIISGYPAGYALGQFGAPRIASVVGWPGVFPVFGTAVLVVSVAFFVVTSGVSRADTSTSPPTLSDLTQVFGNRNVWSVVVVTFLGYSLYMVFNSWMPTYITRQFGISLAESGSFVALFPAIGILARPAGGWVSDGWLRRRRRPVFAASFTGASVLAVAMLYSTTVAALVGVLVLAGVFIQLQIGLLYQSVQEFAAPSVAGTAVSLASIAGWLGSFVAPVAVGELVATAGTYTAVFGFAVALGLGGVLTVWRMAESGGGAATR
jgi:NNP family nitrate/nitrite transporter-like MFS transporter